MTETPDLIPLIRAATTNRFRFFVQTFWEQVSNDPFRPGYLVDAICEHLQALHVGQIKRLVIACPVRHGKTLISQVLYPAWLWARDPGLRLICATLSEPRAQEVSVVARRLLQSDLYQQAFGITLNDDQNTKLLYQNQFGGKRKGCGTGTKIGGVDADVVLVDDLIDYDRARFDAERKSAIDFYAAHLSQRLVAGTGKDRILVAGHRVHEDDLFAHIWQTFGNDGSWTYLVLPEEARPSYTNSFHNPIWTDTREEGELLAPERFNHEWLATQKKQLRHKYNCVYQQDTTPQKGDRFDSTWFQHYTLESPKNGEDDGYYVCGERKLPKSKAWRFATCDTAISTEAGADYTVMQIWDVIGDYCVLVDQLRKRLDGTKIIPALTEFYRLHKPQFVVVEEEFIGKFVIDQLREQGVTVRRFHSKGHGDKLTRAIAVEIRLEARKVWFPADKDWVGDLEAELLAFPHGAHDDQVDAAAQACITADRYRGRVEPELTPEQKQERAEKEKRGRFEAMLNAGCPF